MKKNRSSEERRGFLQTLFKAGIAAATLPLSPFLRTVFAQTEAEAQYDPLDHRYGMGINIKACIGCGRCAAACKKENNVPVQPYYYRTWVEKYVKKMDGSCSVTSPNGGIDGFKSDTPENEILRAFFVPKLCNHCDKAPCVQVCPVGATFQTRDGVVLVDKDYCVGCRYCIQACPYGARFLDPRTKTAEKCTFCYHRITRGLLPACVEVCPAQARIFGDTESRASQLTRFFRFNDIQVLKPGMNTDPQVFYAGLDGEVR